MPRIFISYSSRDKASAEALQQALEANGVGVWRDRTRLETDWSREIAEALANQTDGLCLLWSGHAAQSRWVGHEWLTARALEKRIFPCVLDAAPPLPEPLRSLDAIRFAELDRLVQRLLATASFRQRYDFTVVPATAQIPFQPNPEFEGRHADLLNLYSNLVGNLRKTGVAHVGLGGMAGVGKTQLAVEFAHRFAFAFEHIFWVQAAERDTWLDQFVELARDRLGLTLESTSPTPRQYLLRFQAYCREHQPVLIVMDNVRDPDDLNSGHSLDGLMPLALGANVLFTTRRRFDLSDVGVVEQSIDILSEDHALGLLTGGIALSSAHEKEAARDICAVVGRLPLAIVLIAAFLRKRPMIRYGDYLRQLHDKGLGAIDFGKVSESQLATRHKAAVSETLAEDWKLVQNGTARALAALLALFPEASIVPKARLALLSGVELSSELLDPIVEAFVELEDLRLVEQLENGASARFHPLVREFVNALTSDGERNQRRTEAAALLADRLSDPACLVRQATSRGVAACILDLKAILPWAAHLTGARLLHRLLDREQPHTPPGARLLQQWHHRAFSMGLGELAARFEAAARLEEHPFLREYAVSATEDSTWQLSLRRHAGRITAVCFCPDGRALTASTDKSVILWDTALGQPIRALARHKSPVRCVAAGADGRRAVSGASDGSMILWDLETGEVVRVLKAHAASVESVSVSPDGRRALSGSVDKSVALWDLESGQRIHAYAQHTGWVSAVCFSPDGTRGLSGSQDKTVVLWDVDTETAIRTFTGHSDGLSAVSISPDGRLALTCSYQEILLWELESGDIAQVLRRRSSKIRSVCFTPDATRAVSGHSDNVAVLWDLQDGRQLHTFEGHTDVISSVAVNLDGRLVLSGSHDGTATLWSLDGIPPVDPIGHSGMITSLAFANDGATLLSAADDETLGLWSVDSGSILRQLKPAGADSDGPVAPTRVSLTAGFRENGEVVSGSPRGIVLWDSTRAEPVSTLEVDSVLLGPFSRDGRHALTRIAGRRTVAEYWDLATATVLSAFGGQSIRSGCFDATGRHVLVGGEDGTVALWTEASRLAVRRMESHRDEVTSVCIGRDGRLAVTASEDGTIVVSNVQTGKSIRSFTSLDLFFDELASVAVSAEGGVAVSVGRFGTLVFWNLESGKPIRSTDTARWIRSVCISPDDSSLFAGGEGGRLVRWDLQTGEPLQSFTGHSGTVKSVCCTRDGRWLFSASSDKTVRQWDVASGQAVRSFEEHRDEITSISVSADGSRLLSGSRDKTMILWDTPTGDPLCTLLSECGPIEHISISGDGCRALSVARIDGFEVWDLEASQRTRVIARHLDGISRACFTPDADRVASLSDRHMLIVWDVESGQPVRAMRSRSVIDDLFLSPDGRRALASEGETLVLWDLETGRELRSLRRDGASIEQVCFGPDGDSALSSYKDGALVLWNLRSGLAMTQFYTTSPATAIAWLAKRVALGDAHGVVSFWELL